MSLDEMMGQKFLDEKLANMTLEEKLAHMTLEETLQASIDMVNARKAAETKPPAAGPFLMPAPPPEGNEIPRILSPTSTNTFFDCSMKWFYRKVLHLPETRSAALGLGTAVHTALIENFRQKIETKEDLPVDGVRALFIEAFTAQLDQVVWRKDESADHLKDAGETMVRVYMDRAAPAVEPAAVEEPVEGLIGDVPVHGYIDVRDVDGRVIDIKTAARKPSGMLPAYRMQVATYAMLHPLASGQATLSTLTKTKTVDLHQETVEITPGDRKLTGRLYSIARDQMNAGVYAPNRGSFLCSRKYCSHWQQCEDEFGGRVSE
jgi:putative RecB family exonuclease